MPYLVYSSEMLGLSVTILLSTTLLFLAPFFATLWTSRKGWPSFLLFCFFLVFQQLLFAFAAYFVTTYEIAFCFGSLGVLLSAYYVPQREVRLSENKIVRVRRLQLLPWVLFSLTFVAYASVRAHYAFIAFNNNGDEAGVEKLFNLSLQQSFLHGKSYPPEWVWLSGEPIQYYIFLKSLPGLASWLARTLFGNAATGGVFFILSETFFAALCPAIVCSWILWFGRRAAHQNSVAIVATFCGLFCFLGTHWHAFFLGWNAILNHSNLDWWSLSREVIPFTDNQYPVWFMILGDNHAYMQSYFLQLLLWGGSLALVSLEKFSSVSAAGLGVVFSALVLTHPGSVLVDVPVLGLFFGTALGVSGFRGEWKKLFTSIQNSTLAAAVSLFFLSCLYRPVGHIKIVAVRPELTSRLWAFFDLNFSVLLWSALIFFLVIGKAIFFSKVKKISLRNEWITCVCLIMATILYLISLPAFSVMIIMAWLSWNFFYREQASHENRLACVFVVTAFSIWILPELAAFDHVLDNRTEWIRFQMGLRFWPEAYYLLPFCTTVAGIELIGAATLPRIWSGITAVTISLFLASHIPGINNRVSRSLKQPVTLDGFQDLSRIYPVDNSIVTFLRTLDSNSRVMIAESCGVGDERVPLHFAWPGRFAAFSGRPGVCGWTRHALLYNNPLTQVGFSGMSIEDRTGMFLKNYLSFFEDVSRGDKGQAGVDLIQLKALGVTHVVFGQFEKVLVPEFSIKKIAEILPVKVVFDASNGMGVLQIND